MGREARDDNIDGITRSTRRGAKAAEEKQKHVWRMRLRGKLWRNENKTWLGEKLHEVVIRWSKILRASRMLNPHSCPRYQGKSRGSSRRVALVVHGAGAF